MNTNSKDAGPVIAITGGARGIGLAMAQTFAEQGSRVAIGARSESELTSALETLNAKGPGPHLALRCDVREADSIAEFARRTQEELGTPFGLIAAAAVYGQIGPFLESNPDDWQDTLDINLMGTVRTVQVFARQMAASKRGGRILLFSGGGQNAIPNFAPYVTSKGALWRFTETVAAELSEHRIYLNAIAPGAVNTRFLENLLAAGEEKVGRDLWEKSLRQKSEGGASPLKAARLAQFLFSERAAGLYGRTLSALWDDFDNFKDLEDLSRSDVFAFRRVVTPDGRTKEV